VNEELERHTRLQLPVLYRILRWTTAWYPLGVLWLCILAMIVAFSLMFVFPPGTLLLLFVSLAAVGVSVLGFRLLQSLQRALARRLVARGVCPSCGSVQERSDGEHAWQCAACSCEIQISGAETSPESDRAATEHSTTSRV